MSKRKWQWLILILGMAGVATLAFFFRQQDSGAVCSGMEIELTVDKSKAFVTQGEIADFLMDQIGELAGKPLKDISLKGIEETVQSHPQVMSTEVYTNLDHHILIKVRQHEALVRIHPDNGPGYYLSTTGNEFPLSTNYTERVVVVTGFVDTVVSKKVYTLARHVHRLPFWKAQIEQIFVSEEGDLVLIEKFGNHRLIIGDTDNLNEKFKRLEVFYDEVLKPKGWGNFTTVNAKYNNQLICK